MTAHDDQHRLITTHDGVIIAETRRIDITRPQPESISDIQSRIDRLRDEGRDDLADDLEIWLDHRIMDAREQIDAQMDALRDFTGGDHRG